MRKALTILAVAALAVAAAAYPAAWAIDRSGGREVVFVEGFDAAQVDVNKELFDDTGLTPEDRRRAVVEIYGSAGAKAVPERVVFVKDEDLVVPDEDRTLALLDTRNRHPVQAKSLYFGASRVVVGALIAAAVAFLLRRVISGKPG